MPNIISLGSATKDIFIDAKELKKGSGFCFPLGGKIEMKEIQTFSGGGGVNTAVTFALLGLETGFCGVIGQDLAGQEILEQLNQLEIDTSMVKTRQNKQTDTGIIFHAESERTILLFHEVSRTLNEKDINWKELKNTAWLYVAPLWGKAAALTLKLCDFARQNRIKIVLNPSLDQLKLKSIWEVIGKTEVLLLNDDEASFLTDVKPYDEKAVFSSICSCAKPGFAQKVVITKGKNGATCFDDKFLYQVSAPPVKVIDATGAGDSFGSGFVAGLIRFKNTEKALKLAMANAISNIQVFGANQGLLKKNDELPEIKIIKSKIKFQF